MTTNEKVAQRKLSLLELAKELKHQDRMMEGQTPYNIFNKGLKLIPKEVRTKVS
ncbi:hypothetical protein ACK32U_05305 [Aeromonas dhakensis]|uniref:hypothetical protein n=1 Tax=Aeromonas dhakensis TaxID=196024 RepID=UPI00227AB746|nr:hypothetical protein [Aeromonas dhakensis]WAF79170.1 hypothetical protein NRL00_15635 [Aeromonas dhakensis]